MSQTRPEEAGRNVVVTRFSEAPRIQLGPNTISGLATELYGSTQFEVWTAAHAPASCTHFHRHDSDEVLVFFKGAGVIRTKESEVPFEAPCAVVLPSGTLHQVCNTTTEPTEAIGIIAAGSRIFDEENKPSAWRESYLKQLP